jgi:hypothetical protein
MKPTFPTTRPAQRSLFIAIALVATFSTGAAIDGLAQSYHAEGATTAQAAPVVLAARTTR